MKAGYTFAGWNTAADGTGSSYAAGATLTLGSTNVTLYAEWTAIPKYSVTYDGNNNTSGTVPTDNGSYESGAVATIVKVLHITPKQILKTGFRDDELIPT